jgi:nucleoid-associated protein EbfC
MSDPGAMDGMFKMEGLLQMAKDLQQKLQDTQGQLATLTATAASGGGLVRVTVNGQHRVTALQIDPEAFSGEDPEMLQDLTIAAVNMAMEQVDGLIQGRMQEATGGLNLPFSLDGLGG